MELLFREAAYTDIRYFVMRYEEVWRSTYRDTGIWSEDFFLENVHRGGNRLFDALYDAVGKQLSQKVVIGRKKIREDVYEAQFRIEDRRIFVIYFDDKLSNTRWVESVSIGRKPIIF